MCRAGIFRFADPPMKCLPGRDISCKVRRRYSEERASEAPVATVNCPMNVCQVAPDMRRIVKFLCNNVGLERQLPLSIWKEGSREAVVHMRNKNREGQRLGLAQDTQKEQTS